MVLIDQHPAFQHDIKRVPLFLLLKHNLIQSELSDCHKPTQLLQMPSLLEPDQERVVSEQNG
jgi:hypothetical protein